MVTLIHNVLATDYVSVIHDDDCVVGLELLERQLPLLESLLRVAAGSLRGLQGLFGVSGVCNILGAIRLARHLQLGAEENVVTIATDGFDRYPSVLADLAERRGPTPASAFEEVFRGGKSEDILDVRPAEEKRRLHDYKSAVWSAFGYSHASLSRMESQDFWDTEFARIDEIDGKLAAARVAATYRVSFQSERKTAGMTM